MVTKRCETCRRRNRRWQQDVLSTTSPPLSSLKSLRVTEYAKTNIRRAIIRLRRRPSHSRSQNYPPQTVVAVETVGRSKTPSASWVKPSKPWEEQGYVHVVGNATRDLKRYPP